MEDDTPQKGKGKHGAKDKGRNTGVKQAKIVRQQDRVDAVTGKGRSRGYGFLELGTHADALRVLRWANNAAAVGPLFEEWWQAELEDAVAAEKRKPEGTRDDARIKRVREEIEKGVSTHVEHKPTNFLSILANLTPFSDFNQVCVLHTLRR